MIRCRNDVNSIIEDVESLFYAQHVSKMTGAETPARVARRL